jgi:fagellar hook-basal body proteins
MSQALHTSSTGINAGQSQINVIAHNVANINTTAFKAANMVFEDLYSHNLSYGSAATKNGGGTNPKQIGLGVKIGGITRNFTPGTFISTGRDLDCMISGTGFFVVHDADGGSYFTRDGVFSMDSAGNIVTQQGMKVMGAKSVYSNSGSDKNVKVPKNMLPVVSGDPDLGSKTLSQLNNASITGGDIKTKINGVDVTLTIAQPDPDKTVGDLTVQEVVNAFNTQAGSAVFSIENGAIKYTGDVQFISAGTTSNFVAQTGLSLQNPSFELNKVVDLQDVVNYNDKNVISINNVSVDENGILIATYSDGSVLTQYVDDAETIQWKYTTPEGIVITGSDVTPTGSSIADSNFALELATMVNQEGLVSVGNNMWQWGPDVGDIYYGMAGEMAFGPIESGGYEGSNVDIASELTNMITAQRMIQMNSRVFSAASEVMQVLSYLGQ